MVICWKLLSTKHHHNFLPCKRRFCLRTMIILHIPQENNLPPTKNLSNPIDYWAANGTNNKRTLMLYKKPTDRILWHRLRSNRMRRRVLTLFCVWLYYISETCKHYPYHVRVLRTRNSHSYLLSFSKTQHTLLVSQHKDAQLWTVQCRSYYLWVSCRSAYSDER